MLKGSIGTVSHGTLRTQDLLKAFASELAQLGIGNELALVEEVQVLLRVGNDREFETDYAIQLLEALEDALQAHAPNGCYFGAHEGDGSDFGFWPFADIGGNHG